MKKIRTTPRQLIVYPYNAHHEITDEQTEIRKNLSVKWDDVGKGLVVAIGINPSIATDGKSDNTVTKLCRFLDMYGFDELAMLNLFESSSPQQSNIVVNTRTDFNQYKKLFDKADIILIAWGTDISAYGNEKENVLDILQKYKDKVYSIQKNGNGKSYHPGRLHYDYELGRYPLD